MELDKKRGTNLYNGPGIVCEKFPLQNRNLFAWPEIDISAGLVIIYPYSQFLRHVSTGFSVCLTNLATHSFNSLLFVYLFLLCLLYSYFLHQYYCILEQFLIIYVDTDLGPTHATACPPTQMRVQWPDWCFWIRPWGSPNPMGPWQDLPLRIRFWGSQQINYQFL